LAFDSVGFGVWYSQAADLKDAAAAATTIGSTVGRSTKPPGDVGNRGTVGSGGTLAVGTTGSDNAGDVDDDFELNGSIAPGGATDADTDTEDNDEMTIVSKRIETADALLEEADPYAGSDGGMKSELRPYQRQG
jgi:hypothetical protein